MPVRVDEKFGKAVSELLDERGLSTRAAMYKTGVDYTTILRMRNGVIPKNGVIIDFARGLGESVNKWLVLAGYEPIPMELCLPENLPAEVRQEILRLLKSAEGE